MRHLSFVVAASYCLLACCNVAVAGDIEAHSLIDTVVVRPDAAQVTRVAEVDLPAGATGLVFKGLPLALDPASLRVTGEAGGRLAIGSVEARLTAADNKGPDTGMDTRLRNLRSEREGWQATLDALEAKKAMILRFSQSGPEKLAPDTQPLEIGQWNSAWDTVGAGLAKVGDELRSARSRAREIDDEIKALEAARQRPAPVQTPSREITVSLETDTALSGKISLTYQIAGASWQPLYDGLLDSGGAARKPVLDLVRRALIVQRTGEDWINVSLAVSTASGNRGTAAPDVQPQKIDFYEPPVAESPRPAAAPESDSSTSRAAGKSAVASSPEPMRKPATEAVATVDASSYQAAFRLPGKFNLPGDGSQKSFLISTVRINPALLVRTAPALDQKAFLEVRFNNEEDAPLLSGDIALYRDGAFIGTGHLSATASGEDATLGFGTDDRVKVTRVPVKRKENEPSWYGSTKTETREFKTIVKNLHEFGIRATIVDQVPFSENSAIVVDQLSATTPPTEKAPADKRGVLSWSYDLAAGEAKEIHLAYKMKWPAERDVIFQSVPLPR
jgi:uncharacterized protein (TIGR02231 family)